MDSDTDSQEEKPQEQQQKQQKDKPTHEHIFKTRPHLSKKAKETAEIQFTVYQGSFTLFDEWKDT